jgi:hypothetical protein
MDEMKESPGFDVTIFTGHNGISIKPIKPFLVSLLRTRHKHYNNRLSVIDNFYELHRDHKRAQQWSLDTAWLKIMKLKYGFIIEHIDFNVITYVDVGSGNELKARAFAQLIGADRTVCMDIVDYRLSKESEFVLNETVNTIKSVAPDFCTLHMMLNHLSFPGFDNPVDRICAFINELSNSGCQQVLVREHDVTDEESLTAVVLSHMVYESIEIDYMKKDDFVKWTKEYASKHEGCYMSKADLIAVFELYGWELLKVVDHPGHNFKCIYTMLLRYKKESCDA